MISTLAPGGLRYDVLQLGKTCPSLMGSRFRANNRLDAKTFSSNLTFFNVCPGAALIDDAKILCPCKTAGEGRLPE